MPKKIITIFILICLPIYFLGSFLTFVADIKNMTPQKSDGAEAIIVLTGGSERLPKAFDLIEKNKKIKLFISGVPENVTLLEIVKNSGISMPEDASMITLGHSANNTKENAVETAKWVKDNNLSSIVLITSAYHMPRSLLEFKRLMPSINIIPHPVFTETVKHDEWWKWRGTTVLMMYEYIKYMAVKIKIF